MRMRVIAIGLVALAGLSAGPAAAQSSQATSGTLGGQNTIQQAPSGGSAGGAGRGGAGAGGGGDAGRPTAEERRTEERNNAATQICKGC